MSGNLSNIESIARAICERQIKVHDTDPQRLGTEVGRFWHCVPAELEAGLIHEYGDLAPESNADLALGAYRDWRARHPKYVTPSYAAR
jgi:hypothetical protein